MSSTAEEWRAKRRRRQLEREQDNENNDQSDEVNNELSSLEIRPSAAKRLRNEREEALRFMNGAAGAVDNGDGDGNIRKQMAMSRRALASVGSSGAAINGDEKIIGHQHEQQQESTLDDNCDNTIDNQEDPLGDGGEEENDEDDAAAAATSLLTQAHQLKKQHENLSSLEMAALQRQQDEERILKEASHVQTNALQAASELAEGVKYKTSLPTGWRCPRKILLQGQDEWEKIRKKWHILVEGNDCPPPIRSFRDMGYPKPILDVLAAKNVRRPTPIQMQGLTVALSGRDMVGIAFTGSGKTLSFSLPLVMAAMEEEARMPLVPGEGPVGIVLAPSREVSRSQSIDHFIASLKNSQ